MRSSKELLGECKSRAGGFKLIYDAKEQDNADILFIKQDRKPVLVVMSLDDYIKRRFLTLKNVFKKSTLRVYYEDTDSGGIVYYANYFKFTERCRTELLRESGLSQSEIQKDYDIKFIVHSVSMDYIKPAYLDDNLIVETNIENFKKTSIEFDQKIYKN